MSSSQSKEGEDESMEESKHYGDVFIQKERARRLRSEWLFKRRVCLSYIESFSVSHLKVAVKSQGRRKRSWKKHDCERS